MRKFPRYSSGLLGSAEAIHRVKRRGAAWDAVACHEARTETPRPIVRLGFQGRLIVQANNFLKRALAESGLHQHSSSRTSRGCHGSRPSAGAGANSFSIASSWTSASSPRSFKAISWIISRETRDGARAKSSKSVSDGGAAAIRPAGGSMGLFKQKPWRAGSVACGDILF